MDPIAVSVNNNPIPPSYSTHFNTPLFIPYETMVKISQARRQLCLAVAGDEDAALELELDEARKSPGKNLEL